MPYYTPPGGAMTAAFAQSLQRASMMGLGLVLPKNPIVYRRPTMPPSVLAEQMLAARMASPVTMTGMGIFPSTNVRYTRKIVPITMAIERQRLLREQQLVGLSGNVIDLQGLGKGGPRAVGGARGFDVFGRGGVALAPIHRQVPFFMGPGGGPGSLFPGYSMSGMGLADDSTDIDIVTGLPCDDPRANCGPITGPRVPIDTTTWEPSGPAAKIQNTVPPFMTQTSIPFYQPGQPVRYLPMTAAPIGAPIPGPSSAGIQKFLSSSTMGIPNAILAAGIGGIVLLAGMKKRRRNPSRRRSRRRS